jgi:hypothetical protein
MDLLMGLAGLSQAGQISERCQKLSEFATRTVTGLQKDIRNLAFCSQLQLGFDITNATARQEFACKIAGKVYF